MRKLILTCILLVQLACIQDKEHGITDTEDKPQIDSFLFNANLDSIGELNIADVPNNSIFIRIWKYYSYAYMSSQEVVSILYNEGQYTLSKKFFFDTQTTPPEKDSLIFTKMYQIKSQAPELDSILIGFIEADIISEGNGCLDGLGAQIEFFIKLNGYETYQIAYNNLPCMRDRTLNNLTKRLTKEIDSISGVDTYKLFFSKEYYDEVGWLNRPKTIR